MFRFAAFAFLAFAAAALLFGGVASAAFGVAAFGALLVFKVFFFMILLGMFSKLFWHRGWHGRYQDDWFQRTRRTRRGPETPTRSRRDDFDEWHRMAHAREEVDEWAPEVD